jgi:hypothetical protein
MVGSLSPSRGCIWALQGFVYGFGSLPRLVTLIEDSFDRKLDVQNYLERVNSRIAGVIVASWLHLGSPGFCIWVWEDCERHSTFDEGRVGGNGVSSNVECLSQSSQTHIQNPGEPRCNHDWDLMTLPYGVELV